MSTFNPTGLAKHTTKQYHRLSKQQERWKDRKKC